jgi:hypothetical protein
MPPPSSHPAPMRDGAAASVRTSQALCTRELRNRLPHVSCGTAGRTRERQRHEPEATPRRQTRDRHFDAWVSIITQSKPAVRSRTRWIRLPARVRAVRVHRHRCSSHRNTSAPNCGGDMTRRAAASRFDDSADPKCRRCGYRTRLIPNPYYGVGLAVHEYLRGCRRCDWIVIVEAASQRKQPDESLPRPKRSWKRTLLE